ncbi:MAG: zinc ABC transporter substrate-binding protein [Acidimicrobiales bacterium]|jgi:zinc/manganese transport system substrate-binding protein
MPRRRHGRRTGRPLRIAGAVVAIALSATGCSRTSSGAAGVIDAVGAENEYANVISQVGGPYVSVTAVMSNPNTDPHTFEASPQVAEAVSGAELVVQNGLGYDTFMSKIESAAPNPRRKLIVVQDLSGLSGTTTSNPHLWYQPATMPAVAEAVATDLAALEPGHAAFFHARAGAFEASLAPLAHAIAALKADFPGAPVATTEPVGDYLLEAAGLQNRTPWSLQADIMNGVDPSPQDVSTEESLLDGHHVRVFLYNEQVTDSITQSFLAQAQQAGVPVVAVYETMPSGYDYQSWMLAEVGALRKALASNVSTTRL